MALSRVMVYTMDKLAPEDFPSHAKARRDRLIDGESQFGRPYRDGHGAFLSGAWWRWACGCF